MKDLILRFVIGGTVVSAFAALGDVLKPKSFAGLFGAAPSIALATLGLTISANGKMYAATETRSMIAGALVFFLYAYLCSWLMLRGRLKGPTTKWPSSPTTYKAAFRLEYPMRCTGEGPPVCESTTRTRRVIAPPVPRGWLCNRDGTLYNRRQHVVSRQS